MTIHDDKADTTRGLRTAILEGVKGHPALDELGAHQIALVLLTADREIVVQAIPNSKRARQLFCKSLDVPMKTWRRFTRSGLKGYVRVAIIAPDFGTTLALVERSTEARITSPGGAA